MTEFVFWGSTLIANVNGKNKLLGLFGSWKTKNGVPAPFSFSIDGASNNSTFITEIRA